MQVDSAILLEARFKAFRVLGLTTSLPMEVRVFKVLVLQTLCMAIGKAYKEQAL